MSEMTWQEAATADGFDLDDPYDAVPIAAFVVGPNIKRIATLLGRPRSWVQPAAKALRDGGAWRGRYLNADDADGITLALHGCVARGLMEVSDD